MAEPKITFYHLSHEDYCRIIEAINPFRHIERDSWIDIDKVGYVSGNPPTYSEVTLNVKSNKNYSKLERDEAINALKGLIKLLDFN